MRNRSFLLHLTPAFRPSLSSLSLSLYFLLPSLIRHIHSFRRRSPCFPSIQRSSCILYSRALLASSSRHPRPISRALFVNHPPSRSLRFRPVAHRVFLIFFFRLSSVSFLCTSISVLLLCYHLGRPRSFQPHLLLPLSGSLKLSPNALHLPDFHFSLFPIVLFLRPLHVLCVLLLLYS